MAEHWVEIDLNDVDGEGLTKVLIEDSGALVVGDKVTAYEPEDEVSAPAEVVRVNSVYAAIRVEWTAMTKTIPAGLTVLNVVTDKYPGTAGRPRFDFYGVVLGGQVAVPIPA